MIIVIPLRVIRFTYIKAHYFPNRYSETWTHLGSAFVHRSVFTVTAQRVMSIERLEFASMLTCSGAQTCSDDDNNEAGVLFAPKDQ